MGAWIETHALTSLSPNQLSSHPIWVRGLKLMSYNMDNYAQGVAPYMGAWIETKQRKTTVQITSSHPIWVRGLKRPLVMIITPLISRTLYGCVD